MGLNGKVIYSLVILILLLISSMQVIILVNAGNSSGKLEGNVKGKIDLQYNHSIIPRENRLSKEGYKIEIQNEVKPETTASKALVKSKELFRYNFTGQRALVDVGDIDGDGEPEVAASIMTEWASGYVVLLDNNGKVLWSKQVNYEPGRIIIADLNRDGHSEIILAGRVGSSTVYVYDTSGKLLWSKYLGDWVDNIVVADIDGDGKLEVIAGTWGHNKAWKYNGEVLWSYTGTITSSAPSAVGDVNGDGLPDIIISTIEGEGRIHVLRGVDGKPLWVHEFPGSPIVYGVAVNADNDTKKEVLVLILERVPHSEWRVVRLALLDDNGKMLWKKEYEYVMYLLPVYPMYVKQGAKGIDVNNDGVDELAFYTNDGRILLISSDSGEIIKEFKTGCSIAAGGVIKYNNSPWAVVGCNNSILLLNLRNGTKLLMNAGFDRDWRLKAVYPFKDIIITVGCDRNSSCSMVAEKIVWPLSTAMSTTIKRVMLHKNILLKRANERFSVLHDLFYYYTNPNWWRHVVSSEFEEIYKTSMSIAGKEFDMSLASIFGESLNSQLPSIASTALDITKTIEYMIIAENFLTVFADAVFKEININSFLNQIDAYNLYNASCTVFQGLMASNDFIKKCRNTLGVDKGYNANNVRLLLYYMMNIVSEEKKALSSGDYEKYIKLLKLEKEYAEHILEILSVYRVAANVDLNAFSIFVSESVTWKSGLIYMEIRRGLEQLYTVLADAWLFEYTYILNGESEKPPYSLQLREIYWLPYVNVTVRRSDANFNAIVNVSTVKNYAYKGGLRIEVYPVYKIFSWEFTLPWPIAVKDLDSIEVRYPEIYQVSISFNAPLLKPYKYRIVVYSVNPTIISDYYTEKLRQSEEVFLYTKINVYDKYFSKIKVRSIEFSGEGEPITSGYLVRLDEAQHKLYLTILTSKGEAVGYRNDRIAVEVPGAIFLDLSNGTQIAYLPPRITNYTVVVNAREARQHLESYNITIYHSNGHAVNKAEIKASIKKGEQHKLSVSSTTNHVIVRPFNIRSYKVVYSENVEVVTPSATPTTTEKAVNMIEMYAILGGTAIVVIASIAALSRKIKKRR